MKIIIKSPEKMKGYLLFAVIVVSLAIFVIPVSDVGNWLSKSVMDNHTCFQNKIDFLSSLYVTIQNEVFISRPYAPWLRIFSKISIKLESLSNQIGRIHE